MGFGANLRDIALTTVSCAGGDRAFYRGAAQAAELAALDASVRNEGNEGIINAMAETLEAYRLPDPFWVHDPYERAI